LRTVRRWLTGTALAAGLLLAASPTIAAQAAPATASQAAGPRVAVAAPTAVETFNICLTNSTHLCLVANGPGNQMTIDTHGWAIFHVARSIPDEEFENASGNCLRAGVPSLPGQQGVVKIENGACGFTDGADIWLRESNGRLESLLYQPEVLLVHGAVAGNNVWHFTPRSGDWTNWTFFDVNA